MMAHAVEWSLEKLLEKENANFVFVTNIYSKTRLDFDPENAPPWTPLSETSDEPKLLQLQRLIYVCTYHALHFAARGLRNT